MKLELYRCDFCGAEFPLVPIAFLCPQCDLRHFFWVDRKTCVNELFLSDIKCPQEKVIKPKKAGRWFHKKGTKGQR